MIQLLIASYRHCHDWLAHSIYKITATLGTALAFVPSLDTISRVLGIVAVGLSIYFSYRKHRREEAAASRKQQGES